MENFLRLFTILSLSWLILLSKTSIAANETSAQLSVWANEAIVATYTYDFKTFMQQQRVIAKFFTSQGWTNYSAALNKSKLPEMIQKNSYFVSSVATLPPEIKQLSPEKWQASMPLLVVYKNPQYQQKQTLQVTIYFGSAPSGQGVRGLAISSLQSKVIKEPCQCQPTTNDRQQSPNAKQSEKKETE